MGLEELSLIRWFLFCVLFIEQKNCSGQQFLGGDGSFTKAQRRAHHLAGHYVAALALRTDSVGSWPEEGAAAFLGRWRLHTYTPPYHEHGTSHLSEPQRLAKDGA